VTTVETYVTSTTCPFALPVVAHGAALAGTWTGNDVRVAVVTAPYAAPVQGTGVSIAMRNRTAVAAKTALLPIGDVVVFDGLAGIRSWSPPV
jgi:hypothetical protein